MTTTSVRQAATCGTDNLHLDTFLQTFERDDDDWYVMDQAALAGHDPNNALARRRSVQFAQQSRETSPGTVALTGEMASNQLPMPPGFAGHLASFVLRSAPRPVAEVAVVAALGLLAGICGREWNIPGSGLNLYIILVARSAIGKEAMHSGIGKVLSAVRKRYPQADEFVCFDDFASGQALVKGLLGRPAFVNVQGEIGHKFQAMAKDSDPAHRSLRKALTNTYTKSAFDAVAGGIVYSNAENNAVGGGSAAYSLIGETTPGTFFESLTADMMRDGFMSRFNVVEYTGERPAKNPQPLTHPEPWLADHIAGLMQHAHTLRAGNRCQQVSFTPEAEQLLNDFEAECDSQIRAAADDESQRQMWNRDHLKALRIAGVLAVADRHLFPLVSAEHAVWSIDLIQRDIAVFAKRLRSGEVGEGSDDGREQRLLEICREYLQLDPTTMPDYVKPWNELRRHGLVPRKYLQQRTQRIAAFEKHPRGQREALNRTIQTAIDNGHFQALEKTKVVLDYGFQGQVYAILNTGTFPSANWAERFLEDCKRLRAASLL
jgi:hypothetical protein